MSINVYTHVCFHPKRASIHLESLQTEIVHALGIYVCMYVLCMDTCVCICMFVYVYMYTQ
jgi:hypothetical protein